MSEVEKRDDAQQIIEAKPSQTPAMIFMPDFGLTPTQIAGTIAASGLFKGANGGAMTGTEALTRMMFGRALGVEPIAAIQHIYIIEGHIFLDGSLRATTIKSRPGYDYRVEEHDTEHCVISFYRNGEKVGTSEYTITDATTAGLVRDGSNWKKHPKNMLFNRCISNGQKTHVPETMGGMITYDTDEREEIMRNVTPSAAPKPSPALLRHQQGTATTIEAKLEPWKTWFPTIQSMPEMVEMNPQTQRPRPSALCLDTLESLGITREYWKMTNEEAATAILAFQQISQPFDGDVPDITDPFADQ